MDRQDNEAGWTVSVQSPGTAFLLVSYDAAMPAADLMADTALEALRSEYPDLESDKAVESLAGLPAVGHDVQFFSLDLTNTCWLAASTAVPAPCSSRRQPTTSSWTMSAPCSARSARRSRSMPIDGRSASRTDHSQTFQEHPDAVSGEPAARGKGEPTGTPARPCLAPRARRSLLPDASSVDRFVIAYCDRRRTKSKWMPKSNIARTGQPTHGHIASQDGKGRRLPSRSEPGLSKAPSMDTSSEYQPGSGKSKMAA